MSKLVGPAMAVAFVCMVIVLAVVWPKPSPVLPPRPWTYFTMPAILPTCLVYRPRDGETFKGWEINQPMIFDASYTRNVTISNIIWPGCPLGIWHGDRA